MSESYYLRAECACGAVVTVAGGLTYAANGKRHDCPHDHEVQYDIEWTTTTTYSGRFSTSQLAELMDVEPNQVATQFTDDSDGDLDNLLGEVEEQYINECVRDIDGIHPIEPKKGDE